MKIYIAGSSNELDLCDSYMKRVRALGHTITVDWVEMIRLKGSANPRDASVDERRNYAYDDLAGVAEADLVWLLIPKIGGKRCWVELGAAIAQGKQVIASGDTLCSIFCALVDEFPDHEMALEWLRITKNAHG